MKLIYCRRVPSLPSQGLYALESRLLLVVVLSFLTLVTFSSCRLGEKRASFDGLNAKQMPADEMRIGVYGDFESLSPFKRSSGFSSVIGQLVFGGLVELGGAAQFKPYMARNFFTKKGKEGTELRFQLRRNLHFHNGQHLTARDVKATFDCARDPRSGSWATPMLSAVEDVRILGRYEISFLLTDKQAAIMPSFVLGIVPAEYVPCNSNDRDEVVGLGPYSVRSWSPQSIELSRSGSFWRGAPQIKTISFKTYENKREAWADLVRSELDMVTDFSTDVKLLTENQPHLKVVSYPMNFFHMMVFNTDKQFLADKRVRQALNIAVDRQAIVKRVLKGEGLLSSGVIHPYYLNNQPRLNRRKPYPYDPMRSIKLLESAGAEFDQSTNRLTVKGEDVVLRAVVFSGDDQSKQIALQVQAYLQEIGIRLEVLTEELDRMMARVMKRDGDLFHFYSRSYAEPEVLAKYFAGRDGSFFPYQNRKISSAFETYFAGLSSRSDFFSTFNQEIFSDPPGLFLFWKVLDIAVHARLDSVDLNPGNFWGDIDKWKIDNNWASTRLAGVQ